MEVVFFETPAKLRAWFEKNHYKEQELWVGFHKKASGKPSITWPESVDQALCFGWIDGIRKSIDDTSYKIRFTPRKPTSIWSAVNVKRVEELKKDGLMKPAGLKAFEARDAEKTAIYSHEQEDAKLDAEFEKQLKANKKAWEFFERQAGSYQKAAIWWVISAKQDATKARRLAQLIADSEHGRTIAQFTRRTPKK
jgi:uncharacterized protein YdeI (YjbR/CyaY-like superfamily)